jgi:UDP-glucose 4-epimerase
VRITVLGATGFIGAWTARALVAAGHEVIATVRDSSSTWRIDGVAGLAVIRADAETWPATIAHQAPEVLLSLDWQGVSAAERDDDRVQRRNLPRQAAVVSAALDSGTRRIIGVGSQAELGAVDGVIEEDRAAQPLTAYGRAKVDARSALVEATTAVGAEQVWARVFSVFGPLEQGAWLLPGIARAAAAGAPYAMSSGTQPWSYLYAADAARAIATLATHPGASGDYAIAHPSAPPLRDSAQLFADAVGADLQFGDTAGMGLQPRVTRLVELGWQPQWLAADAFAATAAWFRGEPVADPFAAGRSLPLER